MDGFYFNARAFTSDGYLVRSNVRGYVYRAIVTNGLVDVFGLTRGLTFTSGRKIRAKNCARRVLSTVYSIRVMGVVTLMVFAYWVLRR